MIAFYKTLENCENAFPIFPEAKLVSTCVVLSTSFYKCNGIQFIVMFREEKAADSQIWEARTN